MEDLGQKRQVGHTPQSTWQQVTRAQLAVSAEKWLSRAGCLGWEMTDAEDSGTSASTWFPCCLQSPGPSDRRTPLCTSLQFLLLGAAAG